jgi:threonine dehydrogenase-like Zn-dependent dehydrogenase
MSGTANDYTTVVVGCGLVGICTITTALTMVKTVYAIDSIPERLAEAEKIGAKTIALNENPVTKIKEATGRSIVCHPYILEHSH